MKKLFTAILLLFCAALIWVIASGFSIETSAYITDDFTLSEDGSEITFTTGVGSSMGFVRGFKDDCGDGAHRLKFYSAWGGFNSSLGAKSEYTLKLSSDDTEIYVYHGGKGYELALKKDSVSGQWHR